MHLKTIITVFALGTGQRVPRALLASLALALPWSASAQSVLITTGTTVQNDGTRTYSELAVGTGTANTAGYVLNGGTLDMTDGSSFRVGDFGGTGTFTQNGGSVVLGENSSLNIGNQGGNGAYNLAGGTLTLNSGLHDLGRVGSVGISPADGTLNVSGGLLVLDNGGELILGGRIGTYPQGAGTLNQSGGTIRIQDGTFFLSAYGAGTYNFTGGLLQVGGAGLVQNYQGHAGSTFNWGGGTIQVYGSNLVTSVNAVLTPGTVSTLDTASLNATWNGTLSGGGSLRKEGTGTLTLAGTPSYTGATQIEAGTLVVGTGKSLAQSAGVQIASGATLNLTQAGDATLQNLSGDAGASLLLGTRTLATGTAASTLYAGTVQGTGGLTKQGTGTLDLAGDNSAWTGAAAVQAGTLQVDGIYGGAVAVQGGARLAGGGSIRGAAAIASGGVLAPTGTGTLQIGGNLTLAAGSTSLFEIHGAAPSQYGRVTVGGTAALNGTLIFQGVGGYVPRTGDSFTLIQANAVNGTFASVVNGLANAQKFQVDYAPDAVTVMVTQGSFVPFSASPAATAVARVLDNIVGDSRATALIDALNSIPGNQLPAALASIAPTQATVIPQVLSANAQASMQGLSQRAAEIRSGSTGLSLSQLQLSDGPIGPIPADALLADAGTSLPGGARVFQPFPDNRWGFFAAAVGDVGELAPGVGSQNSSFFGAGFQAGADYRISKEVTLGLSGGYNHSKTDFDDSSSATKVDSARFGTYGTWQDQGGDWIDGMAGGAHHWFDSDRETVGGLAHGNTTGLEFDAAAHYGHDFRPGGGWTLTPTFGMSYVRLMTDGYTEKGSLAPLEMEASTSDSLRSELGGIVSYRFRALGAFWNPYLRAGWNHEFLDAVTGASARFASGAGSLFSVSGESVGRESASFGVGVDGELSERVTLRFSYAGEANAEYQDHQFQAGLRVRF